MNSSKKILFWVQVAIAMNVVAFGLAIPLNGPGNFFESFRQIDLPTSLGFHFGLTRFIFEIAKSKKTHPIIIVLAALAGSIAYGIPYLHGADNIPTSWAILLLAGFGILGLLELVYALYQKLVLKTAFPDALKSYIYFCVLLTLLGTATSTGLGVTRILYPITLDYYLYKIDLAFPGWATAAATAFELGSPALKAFTETLYGILVLSFYLVIGLMARDRSLERFHGMRTLVVPFCLAFFFYSLVPVAGPKYLFFDGRFPLSLPDLQTIPAVGVIVPPFARNGMPSFHLTGALLVWMLSITLRRSYVLLFSSALVLGTLWSTLALGEHYVLDLVVAAPFAATLGWLLINPDGALTSNKKATVWVGLCGVTTFLWIAMLIASPKTLVEHTQLVQWASLVSVVLAIGALREYVVTVRAITTVDNPDTENQEKEVAPLRASENKIPVWVNAIFLLSGFAGLIYEVVYAKALALTFGSTSVATYTVLTVYMGGMALGAWLGGYWAEKLESPLRRYAICEALIGLYAMATPFIFMGIRWIYIEVARTGHFDEGSLTAFRVMLGVLALLFPTMLMGATLPLMFKHVNRGSVLAASAIANLYSANTIGAAFGSFFAAYVLLPSIGKSGSTLIAAALSLVVFFLAYKKQDQCTVDKTEKRFITFITPASDIVLPVQKSEVIAGWYALVILAIGGVITLGLEVVSMHLLATIAGSSAYAFGMMLTTFLLGLGLGAAVYDRYAKHWDRLATLVIAQSMIAICIGVTAHVWDGLPTYFGSFGSYPVQLDFMGRELIRGLVCAITMVPTAVFIGFGYSPAIDLSSHSIWIRGRNLGVGRASFVNTVGNISGVLLTGFVLLPLLGSKTNLQLFCGVATGLSLIGYLLIFKRSEVAAKSTPARHIYLSIPIVFAMALYVNFPKSWDWRELSTGGNVYFKRQDWGEVIESSESIDGGITSVAKGENGLLTLLTNGKFQGNNSEGGEMEAQASFALIPMLHTEKRNSALVIGYGTGMTARVLHELGFKSLDIAEISRDLVHLAEKYFSKINGNVIKKSDVNLVYADGRNYLLTHDSRYDLISIEITSIWFAGAANLYNKEFYQLAKERMNEGGILQQWVQLHHMKTEDLLYIIGTIRSEFKYVWVYFSGGQGVIVASNSHKSVDNLQAETALRSASLMDGYHLSVPVLKDRLIAGPARIDALVTQYDPTFSTVTSTDNNLVLEYSTPKGNAIQKDTVPSNIDFIRGGQN